MELSSNASVKYKSIPSNTLFAKMAMRSHVESIEHAGSYAALLIAIAYKAWRLRWDSKTIAEELGIGHSAVRQHLSRMRMTARWLGLKDDIVPHGTTGIKKSYKPRRLMRLKATPEGRIMWLKVVQESKAPRVPRAVGRSRYDLQEFAQLRAQGKSLRENFPSHHGQ